MKRVPFTDSRDLNEDIFSRKATLYSLYYIIYRLVLKFFKELDITHIKIRQLCHPTD